MEMIMLIGVPASGKSSFYKANFFNTHMRVSLDLLNTRNKETKFTTLAYELQQRILLDNTNVTKVERRLAIENAKSFKYIVKGYYFESKLSDCLKRNELRMGKHKIGEIGVRSKFNALELPDYSEGFDELYYVTMINNGFKISSWKDEI